MFIQLIFFNPWRNMLSFSPFSLIIFINILSPTFSQIAKIQPHLDLYNKELKDFNHAKAILAWNISLGQDQHVSDLNEQLIIEKNWWNNNWCQKLLQMPVEEYEQFRQVYLICQGPRFTSFQLGNVVKTLTKLSNIYSSVKICLDENNENDKCLRIEPDLNKFMEQSRDEQLLRTAWEKMHHEIGNKAKGFYGHLINILNIGAVGAGYADMGKCWIEETEIPDLQNIALKHEAEIDYLFRLLHTFVRFKLSQFYSLEIKGAIPTHLLGNLYAQKWDSLIDIVYPSEQSGKDQVKDRLIQRMPKNGKVLDMVKSAEKFFNSMGFPQLPNEFYEKSVFTENQDGKNQNCHASSANMYDRNDFRLLMCAQDNSTEDFSIIHHELGHIYYFMAYKDLPTIYQDGATSSFHEAVGDTISLSLRNRDIRSLLRTGLEKLPQIKFGLVMDLWRWRIFEDKGQVLDWNQLWWDLQMKYLGVKPPSGYQTNGWDPLGKFHIIDNIPYIRYFFATFLQFQFYETLCEGQIENCEFEGNRKAGLKLWQMLKKGSSQPWPLTLKEFSGQTKISARPILNYFEPLKTWLEQQVVKNGLTLGWY